MVYLLELGIREARTLSQPLVVGRFDKPIENCPEGDVDDEEYEDEEEDHTHHWLLVPTAAGMTLRGVGVGVGDVGGREGGGCVGAGRRRLSWGGGI